jgi:hypothetical protein
MVPSPKTTTPAVNRDVGRRSDLQQRVMRFEFTTATLAT